MGPTFSRGSNFFREGGWGGGVKCLFHLETHISCNFAGGGGQGPAHPTLDPRMD